MQTPLDVPNLSYADRQIILVLPDQIIESMRAKEEEAAQTQKAVEWDKIVNSIIPTSPVIGLSAVAILAAKSWIKARKKGVNALRISRSEAKSLQFTPGHPRDNILYVADPVSTNIYHTFANFHQQVFEDKFCELIKILVNLGAEEIQVEHEKGRSKTKGLLAKGEFEDNNGQAGIHSKKESGSKYIYHATFQGDYIPRAPETTHWLEHEPTWKSIVAQRLNNDLKTFSLAIDYSDDFGITADLKAKALGAGFTLGGEFEKHENTTWRIHGTFGDAVTVEDNAAV